jgi:hypothetical protein
VLASFIIQVPFYTQLSRSIFDENRTENETFLNAARVRRHTKRCVVLYGEVVSHLTLNGRDIPFVNSVKYLGVIFDKKVIPYSKVSD